MSGKKNQYLVGIQWKRKKEEKLLKDEAYILLKFC